MFARVFCSFLSLGSAAAPFAPVADNGETEYPRLVLNFPTVHRPVDCGISPDGRFAVIRTGSYSQSAQGGMLYVVDLTPPVTAASVVVQRSQDYSSFFLSSKAIGFVDDRCVSLSGYALGTDEFFTLTPPFTSYGLGVSGVDVASSYESTTGNALAFDAQRLGFTSVVDVKTGVGLFAPQVPTYSVASPGVAHVYSTGLSNAVRGHRRTRASSESDR